MYMYSSTETMSKGHQLVDPQQPGPSKETLVKTDCNKCLVCQEITPEVLRCPAKSCVLVLKINVVLVI